MNTQQTRDVVSVLGQRWSTVYDVGPALAQWGTASRVCWVQAYMFFLHFAHILFPQNRVMFSCFICEDAYATGRQSFLSLSIIWCIDTLYLYFVVCFSFCDNKLVNYKKKTIELLNYSWFLFPLGLLWLTPSVHVSWSGPSAANLFLEEFYWAVPQSLIAISPLQYSCFTSPPPPPRTDFSAGVIWVCEMV